MANLTPPELGLLVLCGLFLVAAAYELVARAIRQDRPLWLLRARFALLGLVEELTRPRLQLPRRWRRQPEVPVIRPEEDSERLVDALARGPLRIQAAILAGDVPVSCRWVVDASATRYGSWRVDVGPYSGHPQDLTGVYEFTRDTLAAIVEQRRVKAVRR